MTHEEQKDYANAKYDVIKALDSIRIPEAIGRRTFRCRTVRFCMEDFQRCYSITKTVR